jgi:mannose-6-phosphate isomerase-like protein (cupin superfamily)
MLGWVDDIEHATQDNATFRTALYTGKFAQLTVMTLPAGEEIGNEVHERNDQLIRVEQGTAKVTLGPDEHTVAEEHELATGWAAIVPAGTWHNVINAGDDELKLSSIYAPPEHPAGTVHRTKAEAEAAEND